MFFLNLTYAVGTATSHQNDLLTFNIKQTPPAGRWCSAVVMYVFQNHAVLHLEVTAVWIHNGIVCLRILCFFKGTGQGEG